MDAPTLADLVQDSSAGVVGAAYGFNGGANDSGTSVTVEGASGGGVEGSGVVDEAGGGAVDGSGVSAVEWADGGAVE